MKQLHSLFKMILVLGMLFCGLLVIVQQVVAEQQDSAAAISLDCVLNQVVVTLTNASIVENTPLTFTVSTGVITEVVTVDPGKLYFLEIPLVQQIPFTITVSADQMVKQFSIVESCPTPQEPPTANVVSYCKSSAIEDNKTSLLLFAGSMQVTFEIEYDDPMTDIDHQFISISPFEQKVMVYENAAKADDPPITLVISNDQNDDVFIQYLYSCLEPTALEELPQPVDSTLTYLPAASK